jgi:hypothetical protein
MWQFALCHPRERGDPESPRERLSAKSYDLLDARVRGHDKFETSGEGQMTKTVQVHVADSPETIGDRVVGAWRRAERGELTGADAEIHIGFESWETMVRTLSPKRLELLRYLHRAPAKSIRALEQAVGCRPGTGRFWPG